MAKTTGSKKDLSESAQKIWLAGLGALSVAEQEGSRVFRSLVSLGEGYADRMREPVQRASKTVRARAGKALGQIEHSLDDQVSSTLKRVGVPTRREIATLTRRVEELTLRLEELTNGSGSKKKAVARTLRTKKVAKKDSKKKVVKKAAKKTSGKVIKKAPRTAPRRKTPAVGRRKTARA